MLAAAELFNLQPCLSVYFPPSSSVVLLTVPLNVECLSVREKVRTATERQPGLVRTNDGEGRVRTPLPPLLEGRPC